MHLSFSNLSSSFKHASSSQRISSFVATRSAISPQRRTSSAHPIIFLIFQSVSIVHHICVSSLCIHCFSCRPPSLDGWVTICSSSHPYVSSRSNYPTVDAHPTPNTSPFPHTKNPNVLFYCPADTSSHPLRLAFAITIHCSCSLHFLRLPIRPYVDSSPSSCILAFAFFHGFRSFFSVPRALTVRFLPAACMLV